LRAKWLGITLVPALQFHLSDALLVTTGSTSRRRRVLTLLAALGSLTLYGMVLFTSLITGPAIPLPNATYLAPGLLFPLFTAFYWLTSAASIWNVWRAWRRSITRTTRQRMRHILLAIMAAPLGVFPYLTLSGNRTAQVPTGMWLVLIAGNLLVAFMFAQLTANIVYLGSVSSDRVVRVRLYKFMARVPMAASIVLLAYVLTNRATTFLGLDTVTASAITVVGTLIVVEWAIHAGKQHLERWLQFNNEPDVRRIQALSERLLTTQDMQQFLESLLAAGCDALRTPSAFVAAFTPQGPELGALVGSAELFEQTWQDQVTNLLPDDPDALEADQRLRWHDYLILPLYSRQDQMLLGILGLEHRVTAEPFSADQEKILARIRQQSATVLEDRMLQAAIFAAVEGLLPGITAFQNMRSQTRFAGDQLLQPASAENNLADTEESGEGASAVAFTNTVREALTHYWGGPKLTESPLLDLEIVRTTASEEHDGNPTKALRAILRRAIELQRPPGEQSLLRSEWLLYNILELKFVQGQKVRDIARRLAVSESDLYRKQRIAIESVARTIADMEAERHSPERQG
jgi:GAF domain-containing protein